MKFAKQYLEGIEGIEIYPIFSLLIFFSFFVILFWWVITAKKEYIKSVSDMPLNDEEPINTKEQ